MEESTDIAGVKTLEYWEELFRERFDNLKQKRDFLKSDCPIFGLEHGLSLAQRGEFKDSLCEYLKHCETINGFPLSWVVYASEIGYDYSGNEYWQTFESKTPGWSRLEDRHLIRDCFQKFHEDYAAAKPEGRWAQHRTIISWPIAHAILPIDLQREMAKTLYDIRHSITSEILAAPSRLGKLIHDYSFSGKQRFQQITEQYLLIGQIASALLSHGDSSGQTLIDDQTLERLVEDLEREQTARVWMADVRRSTRHKKSLGVGGPRVHVAGAEPERRLKRSDLIDLEPRLILRPISDSSWEVWVEFPDISATISTRKELRESLTRSRFRVIGTSAQPKPGQQLIWGGVKSKLQRWPGTAPLLNLERSSAELDLFLQSDFRLTPTKVRLFRIQKDTLAYEIKTARVRTGESYVVLLEQSETPGDLELERLDLDCEGLIGLRLDIPDVISGALSRVLEQLGLLPPGNVHFKPVGNLPSRWDGQNEIEWLSTDSPIVCIRADYDIEGFLLEVGQDLLALKPKAPGDPIYVELGELGIGLHFFTVHVREVGGLTTEVETVNVRIREPRQWRRHSDSSAPLFVLVDPPSPTIEQFWTGQLDIEVYGPSTRAVELDFALLGRQNETLERVNGIQEKLVLPISKQRIRVWIDKHIVSNKNIQTAYEDAESCRLQISAGEFGTSIIEAVREYTPLRWSVLPRKAQQLFDIKVLDDTGEDSPAQIEYYPLGTPSSVEQLFGTIAVIESAKPGLYVCYQGSFREAVFVPKQVKALSDLQLGKTNFDSPRIRDVDLIILRMKLFSLWESARLAGYEEFTGHFRKAVLNSIQENINRCLRIDVWLNQNRIDSLELGKEVVELRRISHPTKRVLYSRIEQEATEFLKLTDSELAEKLERYWIEYLCWKGRLPWLPSFTISLLTRPPELLRNDSKYSLREGLEALTREQYFAASAQLMLLVRDRISAEHFK